MIGHSQCGASSSTPSETLFTAVLVLFLGLGCSDERSAPPGNEVCVPRGLPVAAACSGLGPDALPPWNLAGISSNILSTQLLKWVPLRERMFGLNPFLSKSSSSIAYQLWDVDRGQAVTTVETDGIVSLYPNGDSKVLLALDQPKSENGTDHADHHVVRMWLLETREGDGQEEEIALNRVEGDLSVDGDITHAVGVRIQVNRRDVYFSGEKRVHAYHVGFNEVVHREWLQPSGFAVELPEVVPFENGAIFAHSYEPAGAPSQAGFLISSVSRFVGRYSVGGTFVRFDWSEDLRKCPPVRELFIGSNVLRELGGGQVEWITGCPEDPTSLERIAFGFDGSIRSRSQIPAPSSDGLEWQRFEMFDGNVLLHVGRQGGAWLQRLDGSRLITATTADLDKFDGWSGVRFYRYSAKCSEEYCGVGTSSIYQQSSCAAAGPCHSVRAEECDDCDPCTDDGCDVVHGGCFHVPKLSTTGLACGVRRW